MTHLKHSLRYFCIVLFGLFLSSIASADATINSAPEQQNNPSSGSNTAPQAKPQPIPLTHVCPAPEMLFLQDLLWYAPHGWRTYTPSFITKMTTFTGAHWVGVHVGQVICTYSGLPKLTFPISLQNPQYVTEPSGYSWGVEVKGVKNCLSANVYDCVFTPVEENNGAVNMEQLKNLKPVSPSEQNE